MARGAGNGSPSSGRQLGRGEVEGAVLCVLALPVSSGGVEVEGVLAKFAGKHLGIEQPAA